TASWWRGRSFTRLVSWVTTAHAPTPTGIKAKQTTSSTAGTRRSPRRSSQETGGASTNASSRARAKGMRIFWPQYSAATTNPALPSRKKRRRAVVNTGASVMVLPPSRAGLPVQQGLDLRQEPGQLHRLGVVVVAAGLQGLLAVAGHGVGGQGDHRDGLRRG